MVPGMFYEPASKNGLGRKLKILIVTQGRFHTFDLAQALQNRGHHVHVISNYPRGEAKKFGLNDRTYNSLVLHRVMAIGINPLKRIPWLSSCIDAIVHKSFSCLALNKTRQNEWDILYAMSGVALPLLRPTRGRLNLVVRGSTHILTQYSILADEEIRTGQPIEKPSRWMIHRELSEYDNADGIVVLSTAAKQSFIDQGIPEHRIMLVRSGVDVKQFTLENNVLQARLDRIKTQSSKLKVLTTGTFSYRKGAYDYSKVVRSLGGMLEFVFVGYVTPETKELKSELEHCVSFRPKVPHHELPSVYADADIFYFPTIEDGYPAVLAQALASGLPCLAGKQSSAPDLIQDGLNGWLIERGDVSKTVDILTRLNTVRSSLVSAVACAMESNSARDWDLMAQELERQHGSLPRNVHV